MFNIGPGELIAICMVALLVLGPEKLPGAVRTVGRVVGELRRISSGFQNELRDALEQSELDQMKAKAAERSQPLPAHAVTDPDIDRPDDDADDSDDDREPAGAATTDAAALTEASERLQASDGEAATEATVTDASERSEASDGEAGTEPTATEAAEPAGADPGEDDEGASESQTEQDRETHRAADGPPTGS